MNKKPVKKISFVVFIGIIFCFGILLGLFFMNRNQVNVQKGASDGKTALLCFKEIAGDSYIEELASIKEAKKSENPLEYLVNNSIYVLDDEAIEIYVGSYLTAAESTSQARGISLESLIVGEWGYESIDDYKEESKEMALGFIKERLAIYEVAKSQGSKVNESEYQEKLGVYAARFGYATKEEFVYDCTPVSIANEMLYVKTLNSLEGK